MLIDSLLNRPNDFVSPNVLLAIGALAALLFGWRLWRLTLVPILWPGEPKLLPYWIPILGHTYAFVRNPEKLIDNGYKYFGNNLPFALTVLGKRTVVIRDVQDVATVWKNTADLSFDPFVQAVMKAFGIAPSSVDRVFANPQTLIHEKNKAESLLINDNPQNKCYMNLERDWFKVQLLAPERLQKLQDDYTQFLRESLDWKSLPNQYVISTDAVTNSKTVSLKGFARYTVSYCSTNTFFGRKLLEFDPLFLKNYQDFEEESWKIFYRLPKFLARSSHAAKEKAIDGLVRYFSLPEEEHSELSWLVRTMNTELQYISVPPRDIAGIVMIITWAINNNAHKIAFWIFAHLLHDPPYLASLQTQIDAVFSSTGTVDTNLLLTACPHLDAIWYETLRLYNASSAVREAMSPCVVGGKSICPGDTVFGPFRQFHLNKSIFGADAQTFNPQRFLVNKALPRTKGYAPFGGGHTYCPGRLFAQREIYLFIATTLWEFELELQDKKQKMPGVNEKMPSAAAMGPAEDVLVILRPRTHKS